MPLDEQKLQQAAEEANDVLDTIENVKGKPQVLAVDFACSLKAFMDLNIMTMTTLGATDEDIKNYIDVSAFIAKRLVHGFANAVGVTMDDMQEALVTARQLQAKVQQAMKE